jgi:hypothetical protein
VTDVTPETGESPRATQSSSDPVAELIEAGIGRRRLAAELNIIEHQARLLLAERRNGSGDVHS